MPMPPSATADPGLVYGCMTHVPMWVEFPPFVSTIHLGRAQGDGALNLRDLAPEWEPHHPVLGGTAGSFALKNHLLKHRPDATRVGLCQYRKFVSRERITALPDEHYRSMDLVPKVLLTAGRFDAWLHPGARQFLVGAPTSWGQHWKRSRRLNYLAQYASAHHVEDLLRFAAIAVELKVLDKDEVRAFFDEDTFVPGGIELGVFPVSFWLPAMAALESVVRECVHRYPAVRDGYQTRSWAFCCERLGSYLLLRHLKVVGSRRLRWRRLARVFPPAWVRDCTGQLNLITETGTTQYVGGT
jgi:hypothetical protein